MARNKLGIYLKENTNYWKIFWFEQAAPGDIYFGNTFAAGLKTSAHLSGEVHTKFPDSEPLIKYQGQRLQDFKRTRQNSFSRMAIQFLKTKCPVYKTPGKGLIIELLPKTTQLAYTPFLLEPTYEDDFRAMLANNKLLEDFEIFIFKETNPWFVILVSQDSL